MHRTKLSQPHELFNASGRDVLRCIIDDGDPDGEVIVSTTGAVARVVWSPARRPRPMEHEDRVRSRGICSGETDRKGSRAKEGEATSPAVTIRNAVCLGLIVSESDTHCKNGCVETEGGRG